MVFMNRETQLRNHQNVNHAYDEDSGSFKKDSDEVTTSLVIDVGGIREPAVVARAFASFLGADTEEKKKLARDHFDLCVGVGSDLFNNEDKKEKR